MATNPEPQQPTVPGVTDTRHIPLAQLAGQQSGQAEDALRNVLPADETMRVAVAAFGSSI